jgi:hypothetical protein
MACICELSVRLSQFGLRLGEFLVDDSVAALPGEGPSVSLKFREYLGPDTTGLSGQEFVFPLQALTEFLEKQVCESAADGANRIVRHSHSPLASSGCAETERQKA